MRSQGRVGRSKGSSSDRHIELDLGHLLVFPALVLVLLLMLGLHDSISGPVEYEVQLLPDLAGTTWISRDSRDRNPSAPTRSFFISHAALPGARFLLQAPESLRIGTVRGGLHDLTDTGGPTLSKWKTSADSVRCRQRWRADRRSMPDEQAIRLDVDCELSLRTPSVVDIELTVTNTGRSFLDRIEAEFCLAARLPRNPAVDFFLSRGATLWIFSSSRGWSRTQQEHFTHVVTDTEPDTDESPVALTMQVVAPGGRAALPDHAPRYTDVGLTIREGAVSGWMVGFGWDVTGQLDNLPLECSHASPVFGQLAPGETARRLGRIYFHEGDRDSLLERYADDFDATLRESLDRNRETPRTPGVAGSTVHQDR